MNLSLAYLLYDNPSKDLSEKDYYSGGMVMPDRSFSYENYRFGFNTQEKVDQISGSGNHNTALFWEYDTRTGRRWNLDFKYQISISNYATFSLNPINYSDIFGDSSTHTGADGRIIAVFNDGDKSVYRHGPNADGSTPSLANINKRHEESTSAGGIKMGETEYWDEFIIPGSNSVEGTIHYGEDQSWEPLISWANEHAKSQDLSITMEESKHNKILDIKTNSLWAPQGPMTGRLLNGKYATARSAGNYLAGLNGVTGTFQGVYISGETYMKLAGAYQQKKLTAFNAMQILSTGKSFGQPPYYGEQPYSGRRILEGINAGNKILKK